MPSVEMQRRVDILRAIARDVVAEPAAQRAALDALTLGLPPDPDVRVEPVIVAGRAAEWVSVPKVDESQVVVHFHGGGFCAGQPAVCRQLAGRVSREAGARVLLPSYRLAPEHRFPAPVEDAAAVYAALLAEGVAAERVVIGGDSAGGNLALAAVLLLRDRGAPLPAAVYGLSPFVDLTLSSGTMNDPASEDPVTSPLRLVAQCDRYLAGADPANPLASPALANLEGLPPIHIEVGSTERLAGEARAIVARALEAGILATLVEVDGAFHCFQMLGPETPEAAESVARVGAFIRKSCQIKQAPA